MLVSVPFAELPSSEAVVSNAVNVFAAALAAHLYAEGWGEPQVTHAWDLDAYQWQTSHHVELTRGATRVSVSYGFGGSGRDGGGSFSLSVSEGRCVVLSASHQDGQWHVSEGDDAAIKALRAACRATC